MNSLDALHPALLDATALAARSALLGGAAFLAFVASPMARRLPDAQADLLMARNQAFLRVAALAVAVLCAAQLLQGRFGLMMGLLAALAVLVLTPRNGPSPRLAFVILLLAAFALLVGVTEGDTGRLSQSRLTQATALREAGAALWMGNLPLLWMALRPGWPPAVSQAVGARHAALMLCGMAMAAGGLLVAWPDRGLLLGAEALPFTAITLAMLGLALLAAMLRLALLAQGAQAGAAPTWLPRLGAVVEGELLLALALCGPIVALFALAATGLTPAATPDLMALLPRLAMHPLGLAEAAGLILLLMALLAWLHRAGGPPFTRFGPLLLLPLGAVVAAKAGGPVGVGVGALTLLAGAAEAWRLWSGRAEGLALAMPFAVVAGLVLVLASRPPASATLPCLLALVALLIRWAELRLHGTPDARIAAIAWPFALGALGLVLTLTDGG